MNGSKTMAYSEGEEDITSDFEKLKVNDDNEEDNNLLNEIMMDVAAAELASQHNNYDHPQSLEDIMRDTDYLDIDFLDTSVDMSSSSSNHNTPKKTPLNLAIPAGGIDADISDTLSIKSFDSKSGRKSSSFSQKSSGSSGPSDQRSEFGSIMRHVILKAVSSQLTSAVERLQAGQPTCMTTTHLIAIGTQNGFVLVFDSSQVIKWFLGGVEIGKNYGAVSCLAFNTDSSRLLAGFARGQMMEFDVVSGKIVRDMTDVHPPGSAVTMVKYSDDSNTAFLADSGGSVYELSMKRGLRGPGATARCIFSGSRGEVCSMEPLRVASYQGHPLGEYSILALATISKVITVTVKPKLKVLMTSQLKGDASTLPMICWQFVVIQNPSLNKVVDPVLTFARDQTIHFYQVTVNLSDKIVFIPVQCVEVPYKILSLHWLNTRLLGLLSTSEQFHLMDVRTGDQLETVDLTNVRMVYQTQFFKSLATGGNVSPAMSLAGEMAVYGSITSFTNQMLVLGGNSFHVLVIRSWSERLEHLLRSDKVIAAMHLGSEFYEDPAKTLVGLRGSRERKQKLISMKLIGILKKFLSTSLTTKFPVEGGMGTLTKYFNEIVPPCVDLCIRLGETDLLFDTVWNTFNQDPFSRAVYLESLEPYILSDQVTRLPTSIVQQFVSHYEARDKLEGLEACLTHFAVDCLDIHQAMSICQQHNLFDAIIYIYNNAMLDYITPVEKLLRLLSNQTSYDDNLVKLGNKLLVYISQCLAGRAYPYGDIPGDRVKQAKYDVYSTITLLSARNSDNDQSYPHLHTLLMFDTQGFLNVLSIAFEEEEFSSEVGQCQKQRLVDILLHVMVGDMSPFSGHQVGYLASFLARQLARTDNTVLVSRDVFTNFLLILTRDLEPDVGEQQQAVMDIIQADDHGWSYFDLTDLEEKCQAAGFYRVLEKLYERSGRQDDILSCYLEDKTRQSVVFSWLSTSRVSEATLLEKMNNLIHIDVVKFADIVIKYSDSEDSNLIRQVLDNLQEDTRMLYEFLHHVLSQSPPHVSPDMYSCHLQLMCQYHPDQVVQYLSIKDNHEHYDINEALQLCNDHGLIKAKIYLFERQGRVKEAFDLLIETLNQKMTINLKDSKSESIEEVSDEVKYIVEFCQRSSQVLSTEVKDEMWCSLLQTCVKPEISSGDQEMVIIWRSMVRNIVSSMLGEVTLSKIVNIIISDEDGHWSEVKQVMGDIMDMARYEATLVESTMGAIRAETADMSHKLMRYKSRGLRSYSLNCALCHRRLNTEDRSVVFRCHHGYHLQCLEDAGGVSVRSNKTKSYRCVICTSPVHLGGGYGSGRVDQEKMTQVDADERVKKAKEFLTLYSNPDHGGFDSGSMINSEKFSLQLKPGKK